MLIGQILEVNLNESDNMKTLIASEFVDESNTGYCIKRAFDELGHETKVFDIAEKKFEKLGYKEIGIGNKGKSFISAGVGIIRKNRAILKEVKKDRPEMLLIFKGKIILPKTIQKIRDMGIKTVLWHPDPRYEIQDWVYKRAIVSDYFFHISSGCVEQYKEKGVNAYWLSEGCDPTIHKPIKLNKDEKEYYGSDISFSGHYTEDRERFLKSIINAGIDLNIWHHMWKDIIPDYKGCIGKWLTTEEFCKMCNASKIVLGNDRWPEMEKSMSMRAFMVMGCGGFLLTNHTKNIEEMFIPGKHLDVYENERNCVEKIKYYLENERERIRIEKAGHKEVYKNHTFVKRIEKMMSIVFGS